MRHFRTVRKQNEFNDIIKPKGEIEYLHKEDTLRQGLERMRIYGYTALPVIDEDGCYAGSVNEGEFFMVYVNISQM